MLEFSKRIITKMPIEEIWDDSGIIKVKKTRSLYIEDSKALLRKGPVQFIIASVGYKFTWIPIKEAFDFWKSGVQLHFVDPKSDGFYLDDFPHGWAYIASEWLGEYEHPIVLLEMYH